MEVVFIGEIISLETLILNLMSHEILNIGHPVKMRSERNTELCCKITPACITGCGFFLDISIFVSVHKFSDPGKTVFIKFENILEKILSNDEKMPWEIDDTESTINQRGSGAYSLCEECNNLTGHWYGAEYMRFAQIAAQIITTEFGEEDNAVEIYSVHPLRLIKQILSMFCSISESGEKMQTIRDFVLDRGCNWFAKR